MSFWMIEDILDILRWALEYFGVPPDMLIPVWDSPLCGQYRSIVRMIGSNLALTPAPRAHFLIPLQTSMSHGYVDVTTETPAILTFADVLWLADDEGDSFTKIRNRLPPMKRSTVNHAPVKCRRPAQSQAQIADRLRGRKTDPDALKKISALEDELHKLRAQIAMIVIAAPASGMNDTQNTPPMSPAPPPVLTSTPHSVAPPPPPPPPPPTCALSSAHTASALDLIHQRKRDRRTCDQGRGLPLERSDVNTASRVTRMPSMLDVLKDLNHVKLRSVQRSPGGTPFRRSIKGTDAALLCDPAALIAEALKKKFAHHILNYSSDKENSVERSPFGSPDAPQVPKHSRRSQGSHAPMIL